MNIRHACAIGCRSVGAGRPSGGDRRLCQRAGPLRLKQPFQDPMLVQQDAAARAAFAEGNYDHAARFYELALTRARATRIMVPKWPKPPTTGAPACSCSSKPEEAAGLPARGLGGMGTPGSGPLLRVAAGSAGGPPVGRNSGGDFAGGARAGGRARRHGAPAGVADPRRSGRGSGAIEPLARRSRRRAALLTDDPALRAGVAGLAGRWRWRTSGPPTPALPSTRKSAFLQRAARWSTWRMSLRRAGRGVCKGRSAVAMQPCVFIAPPAA
jgi:hypothetical protein